MAVSRLAQKVARAVRSLEVRAHAALKERFAELGFVPR
jgi:Fe2+ transport system protein FeoA